MAFTFQPFRNENIDDSHNFSYVNAKLIIMSGLIYLGLVIMAQKKKELKKRENLQCHWHCPCADCRTDENLVRK